MRGYNNSIAAAALLLGMEPEMLMKCLEGSNAIAGMQLEIDTLKHRINKMQQDNEELCRILTNRLTNGQN